MICCWTSQCFFRQYPIVQVFWVLGRYIILSFDMYHGSIVYMHERTLLSDYESVVSVTRREQQLEQTYLTICFLLLFCFVVVLFCFYFSLFVSDSSWSIIIYMCGGFFFSCWPLHCFSFDLRLRITPLVSSNFSYTHHVFLQ